MNPDVSGVFCKNDSAMQELQKYSCMLPQKEARKTWPTLTWKEIFPYISKDWPKNSRSKICASRIGQPLNHADIGAAISADARTIAGWLSILEASYISFELRPYYNNFGKRITKRPKFYFYDTGLACALLELKNAAQLVRHRLRELARTVENPRPSRPGAQDRNLPFRICNFARMGASIIATLTSALHDPCRTP